MANETCPKCGVEKQFANIDGLWQCGSTMSSNGLSFVEHQICTRNQLATARDLLRELVELEPRSWSTQGYCFCAFCGRVERERKRDIKHKAACLRTRTKQLLESK